MTIWKKTKFPGVRYKESPTRRRKGKPERYYSIRYQRHGKSVEEGVGWESAGVTPQYCNNLRGELVTNIRTGKGDQSFKDRRSEEEAAREVKRLEREAMDREGTPFDVLAQHYLDWSEHNKAAWKDDESRYRLHIKPNLGNVPIKEIGVLHLERLKRDLKTKKKSPQTILHCLSLVRSMFSRASGWGLFDGPNPVKETAKLDKKFLKIPDASRLQFFSHEQANTLLKELGSRSIELHDKSLLSLHSGMRAGEIFSITWADVDLRNEIVTVRNPKNDELRRVHMTKQVKAMFERRRPEKVRLGSLVFTNRKGEKLREVSNSFDRAIEKLKFNKGVTNRRDRLVFHSLRHSFASWLAIQGESLLTIKELMGHKKIEMTMKYSHLLPDQKKDAVLKLAKNQSKKIVKFQSKRKKK